MHTLKIELITGSDQVINVNTEEQLGPNIDPCGIPVYTSEYLDCMVSYQGWQPAFNAGIIRRLKPVKSGFYRLLLAFTIFLLFSSTKTVLSILYVY